jgi:hypothetical protein
MGRLKFLYGVAVWPDGSVIFNMQSGGRGIVKVDACSRILWSREGKFHHAISPTDDMRSFWTFGGDEQRFNPRLLELDAGTGNILRAIKMADVAAQNPRAQIFLLQPKPGGKDLTHPNDIEPLPAAYAAAFPMAKAGDLLISYRSTNLVYILDPDSLAIKWWRVGPWARQHDPDWEPDGRITVFNNNEVPGETYSNIVSIDPKTFQSEVILDGRNYDFRSEIVGRHQLTPRGTMLITSGMQGRVFEVDAKGKVIFEFVNSYDWKAGKTLKLSEATYLDEDFFEPSAFAGCPPH